ncbi:hypothetical protein ACIRQY_10290 [Streptomyces sp. NPDC101490]|uniref:hypothetical protein n=1 Tax=Streptomyces sp. NPDC101490 TaxID=3366143 RepID=UPI0037FE0FCF
MVDTGMPGYVRLARALFLWGLALILPGLGALWYANRDAAVLWECEGTSCRIVPSVLWRTVEYASLGLIMIGLALACAGYLLYKRKRR